MADAKKEGADTPAEPEKPTLAAGLTRSKSLKAKMNVTFNDARLGDVLKEFAAQVEMRADTRLLWTYGPKFPYSQKVSYTCKDKPLEEALDELFSKIGGLGFIVLSKDGDRKDGWILLTTTGERGYVKGTEPLPKATEAEEKAAADLLTLAKKLIDAGKLEQAKNVLTILVKRHPGATAGAEGKRLLMTLEK
jgi:hypothetical protein